MVERTPRRLKPTLLSWLAAMLVAFLVLSAFGGASGVEITVTIAVITALWWSSYWFLDRRSRPAPT